MPGPKGESRFFPAEFGGFPNLKNFPNSGAFGGTVFFFLRDAFSQPETNINLSLIECDFFEF